MTKTALIAACRKARKTGEQVPVSATLAISYHSGPGWGNGGFALRGAVPATRTSIGHVSNIVELASMLGGAVRKFRRLIESDTEETCLAVAAYHGARGNQGEYDLAMDRYEMHKRARGAE